MQHKKHTLKNGLRVILAPMADTQTVTVMIMAGTGSRYEDEYENGLAHFLEHMFFKGTKKRKDAQAVSMELDAIGGEYNAFTGKDRTAYYAKVSSQHVDTALDVVSDIFLNSKLEQKEISKESGTIVQEINMYEDMPMRTVDDVFEGVLFGTKHPLGRTILGPKKNILSFKRKDFAQYLKRCYTSQNVVVCVAGKFSQAKVLAKIRADFADMNVGAKPEFVRYEGEQDAPAVAIKQKKTDQTHLMLGVRAYDHNHVDRYALAVLSTILGGGMSSRLFSEVREKLGLAYFVRTDIESYPDTGCMVAQAGVEHDNLEKTVKVIIAQLRKLTKKLVPATELTKAKEYMKGHTVLGLESSDSIANYLISQETVKGYIRTPDDAAKKIDAVTAADIRRVAQELFVTEQLNLAIIGPHKGKEDDLRKLLKI